MVVDELYRQLLKRFDKIEYANAQYEVGEIFSKVLGIKREDFLRVKYHELTDSQIREIEDFAKKREQGYPLQYLLNFAYFMECKYYVNHSVLIPREDTEVAVRTACEYAGNKRISILELGAGSGIISISLFNMLNDPSICAVDISNDALEIAKRNAADNGADIEFLNSNLYQNVTGEYDLIISNPPYIPTDIINTLQKEVFMHEPIIALDGGADGLDLIRIIVTGSLGYLKSGGALILEIGFDQGDKVVDLMLDVGFTDVQIRKDFAGHDRVVYGKL